MLMLEHHEALRPNMQDWWVLPSVIFQKSKIQTPK